MCQGVYHEINKWSFFLSPSLLPNNWHRETMVYLVGFKAARDFPFSPEFSALRFSRVLMIFGLKHNFWVRLHLRLLTRLLLNATISSLSDIDTHIHTKHIHTYTLTYIHTQNTYTHLHTHIYSHAHTHSFSHTHLHDTFLHRHTYWDTHTQVILLCVLRDFLMVIQHVHMLHVHVPVKFHGNLGFLLMHR